MRSVLAVALFVGTLAQAACSGSSNDAHETEPTSTPPASSAPGDDSHGSTTTGAPQTDPPQPVLPGSDGVIEPHEGQPVLPPDIVPHETRNAPSENPALVPDQNRPASPPGNGTRPPANDQLERNRTERAEPL